MPKRSREDMMQTELDLSKTYLKKGWHLLTAEEQKTIVANLQYINDILFARIM